MKKILLFILLLVTINQIDVIYAKPLLSNKINNFEINEVPIEYGLQDLKDECKKYNIIINFEEAIDTSSSEINLISCKSKDTTIYSILNNIVKKGKFYTWKSKRNIINVIPYNKLNDPDYILNKKIKDLIVINKNRKQIIIEALTLLNKNYQGKYKLQLNEYPYDEFNLKSTAHKKYSFSLKDTNLREILNKISIESNISWYIMLGNIKSENIRFLTFVESDIEHMPPKHK